MRYSAPPPACDSPQVVAETAIVHNFPRAVPGTPAIFATNYKAVYWQSPEGLNVWPYRYADKWMFEDRLDQNPPRAARVYALIGYVAAVVKLTTARHKEDCPDR